MQSSLEASVRTFTIIHHRASMATAMDMDKARAKAMAPLPKITGLSVVLKSSSFIYEDRMSAAS